MIIKKLIVGPIQANCFILGCEKTGEATVIDPGDEADHILNTLKEEGLTAKYLLCTHGHFDHVGANGKMKAATGAGILIHPLDASMLGTLSEAAALFDMTCENSPPPDRTLEQGDEIKFGEITLTVIHTPGHTPGGISFLTGDSVFVGDTLFGGSVGRTDLPGGDWETLQSSILNKLYTLDEDTKVFPGHMENTVIGDEKRHNPFVHV